MFIESLVSLQLTFVQQRNRGFMEFQGHRCHTRLVVLARHRYAARQSKALGLLVAVKEVLELTFSASTASKKELPGLLLIR